MRKYNILALPGEGVGPEIMQEALRLLEVIEPKLKFGIDVKEDLLHGQAWDEYGTFCRDETVNAAKSSDAVLVGAVGAKKCDSILPEGKPEEKDGLMRLRKELIVTSEEKLGIPIIIWENGGLKQIKDDMNSREIPLVVVEGGNPDFIRLSESMGCDGIIAESLDHATENVLSGFRKDRPTLIIIREGEKWLN